MRAKYMSALNFNMYYVYFEPACWFHQLSTAKMTRTRTKGKFDEKDLVIRHSNDTKERKLPPKR